MKLAHSTKRVIFFFWDKKVGKGVKNVEKSNKNLNKCDKNFGKGDKNWGIDTRCQIWPAGFEFQVTYVFFFFFLKNIKDPGSSLL